MYLLIYVFINIFLGGGGGVSLKWSSFHQKSISGDRLAELHWSA